MGKAEDEERAREQRRAEIRAAIRDCRNKISRLNNYKERINAEHTESNDFVDVPSTNYDLTVSVDYEHWLGNLQADGDSDRNTLVAWLDTFLSGINNVVSTIDRVIQRLYDEIASLEDDLRNV